ncbi:hypothetical protein PIB30_100079 [Stylosanthes scabra]|uniref:Uncharacterized protein n=1 Tax=Stylosanthes scabra TaxID=79078 RepID=A0ABU6WWY4_9FABA|nr:hypothetical protein [Stylosanthes scabra]
MVNQQNNFYRQIKREQEKTIKEIEEVKKFQVNQTLMGARRTTEEAWRMSLPSTHMLAVLRICVALEWASMVSLESRLNDSGVGSAWLLATKVPSTHMRGSSTPMRGWMRLEDVRVMFETCVNVTRNVGCWFPTLRICVERMRPRCHA